MIGRYDEQMLDDPETMLRLTLQTLPHVTLSMGVKPPCKLCDDLGYLEIISDEREPYIIMCKCHLAELLQSRQQKWNKLSVIPVNTHLVEQLSDFVRPPGATDIEWHSFERALAYAHDLTHQPLEYAWMTLLGDKGCGKTSLLVSIYRRIPWCCVYLGAGALTTKIFSSFDSNTTEELTQQLIEVPVLLLDDWGVDILNATIQNKITQIIDARYMQGKLRPTVIASNLSTEQLHQFNARVGSRIVDQDLVKVVGVTLSDYRRRDENKGNTVVRRSS